MKFNRISFFFFLLLLTLAAAIQPKPDKDFAKYLNNNLKKYLNQYPQEKVYLHFDKPFYASGENMWFKGYLVDAFQHTADTLSGVLYVDLIDSERTVVANHKLKVVNGITFGDFALPDTLKQDLYMVRAYTNWMRNFDTECFFEQKVPIFKLDSTFNGMEESIDDPDFEVEFYPEGGYLIGGLTSKVGIKLTGPGDQGVALKGEMVNQFGEKVADFETNEAGIGAFTIRPEKGIDYYAKFDNLLARQLFPEVMDEGYVLTLSNLHSKKIKMNVAATFDSQNSKSDKVYLVFQNRGNVILVVNGTLENGIFYHELDRKDLPDGIIQVTMFDEEYRPQCERLIFNGQLPQLAITVDSDSRSYDKREKVQLKIKAEDESGKPIQGHFSVSVYDAVQVGEKRPYSSNIVNYLYLESDLNGKLEIPGIYFKDDRLRTRIDLDYLMMTHGWRRYTWKKVLQDSIPEPFFEAEKNINIKGKVNRLNGDGPVAGDKQITLGIQNITSPFFEVASIDNDGYFNFQDLTFYGESTLILQVQKRSDRIVARDIELYGLGYPDIPFKLLKRKEVDQALVGAYLQRGLMRKRIDNMYNPDPDDIMLEEITIQSKRDLVDYRKPIKLYDKADYELTEDDLKNGFPNIFEALMAQNIPGMRVRALGFNNYDVSLLPSFSNMDGLFDGMGANQPLYILDGIPVTQEDLLNIPTNDISSVDILRNVANRAVYGSRGEPGVILVYTKRGENADNKKNRLSVFPWDGFYQSREFYSPDYSERQPEHIKPDFRPTLFWNPLVLTDENGEGQVEFYTSDVETVFEVDVQGISFSGIPGVGQHQFSTD